MTQPHWIIIPRIIHVGIFAEKDEIIQKKLKIIKIFNYKLVEHILIYII